MNDKTTLEVLARVDALGAKLGVAAGHLWQVLVAQARVDAFVNALVFIVTVAPIIVYAANFKRLWRLNAKATYSEDGYGIALVLGGVVTAVCVICAFVALNNVLTDLLNPEYAALSDLLEAVRRRR